MHPIEDKLQEYYSLKATISAAQSRLNELKPDIEEAVIDNGEPLVTRYGTFRMVWVPRWKYSAELTKKEKLTLARLKLAKKEEQENDIAEKISDGGRLTFTTIKIGGADE